FYQFSVRWAAPGPRHRGAGVALGNRSVAAGADPIPDVMHVRTEVDKTNQVVRLSATGCPPVSGETTPGQYPGDQQTERQDHATNRVERQRLRDPLTVRELLLRGP